MKIEPQGTLKRVSREQLEQDSGHLSVGPEFSDAFSRRFDARGDVASTTERSVGNDPLEPLHAMRKMVPEYLANEARQEQAIIQEFGLDSSQHLQWQRDAPVRMIGLQANMQDAAFRLELAGKCLELLIGGLRSATQTQL